MSLLNKYVYKLVELLIVDYFQESFNVIKGVLTCLTTCHEDMASLGGGNSVAR